MLSLSYFPQVFKWSVHPGGLVLLRAQPWGEQVQSDFEDWDGADSGRYRASMTFQVNWGQMVEAMVFRLCFIGIGGFGGF